MQDFHLSVDAKVEIEEIFERRPPDSETQWPQDMDTHFGNPVDMCVCGHQRQSHGDMADDDIGVGECGALIGGQPLFPEDGTESFHVTLGGEFCSCKHFHAPIK